VARPENIFSPCIREPRKVDTDDALRMFLHDMVWQLTDGKTAKG